MTQDPAAPIRLIDPALLELWNHWCALRRGRSCPSFDEFDPGALGAVADRLLVVKKNGNDFRYSFVGSSIQAIYGYPMFGLLLSVALPQDRRDGAINRYRCVCDSGRPLFARNAYEINKTFRFRVDRLILPLMLADGTVGAAVSGQIMRSATDQPAGPETLDSLTGDTQFYLDLPPSRAAG